MKVLDFIGGESIDKAYALAPEVVAELSSYVDIVVEKSASATINVGRHIVEAAASLTPTLRRSPNLLSPPSSNLAARKPVPHR